MKHFSTVLSVVLLLAVAFLYYHEFSGKKPMVAKVAKSGEAKNEAIAPALIAYVELDSLNEKISFIKEKRKELESEQRAIETEWENGYRGLENQKNAFLRKGDAITQQMAEEFQNDLIQQQQTIDQKKQGLTQKLSEKIYKFMESIQKDLKDILIDYNKIKNYQYILTTTTGDYMVFKDSTLNITADVVNGMNEKIKKGNK